MISQVDVILEKILTSNKKELVIDRYIKKPVREDLKSRGYKIEESGGVYTIKW